MKPFIILIAAVIVSTVACNKDKITTIPQLNLKSISPGTVFTNDVISIKGEYSDQEGDLDSVLVLYKFFNGTTAVFPFSDTFRYSVKSFDIPVNTKEAEITIQYQYNNLDPANGYPAKLPGLAKDTTAAFGIIIKDAEGNRSEYKETEQIRIKKS